MKVLIPGQKKITVQNTESLQTFTLNVPLCLFESHSLRYDFTVDKNVLQKLRPLQPLLLCIQTTVTEENLHENRQVLYTNTLQVNSQVNIHQLSISTLKIFLLFFKLDIYNIKSYRCCSQFKATSLKWKEVHGQKSLQHSTRRTVQSSTLAKRFDRTGFSTRLCPPTVH